MQGSPHNLSGAVGRLVGGEHAQAVAGSVESGIVMVGTGDPDLGLEYAPYESLLQFLEALESAHEYGTCPEGE